MPDPGHAFLQRYLPWRRPFEVGFWVFNFLAAASVNSIIVLMDVDRAHLPFASWQPVAWEWSSNLALLALVPAVLAFERWKPLQFGLLRRNLPWHLLASVVFSLLHVVAMVAMWSYVLYLAFGPGRQDPPDRLDDPAFATAAQDRCDAALDTRRRHAGDRLLVQELLGDGGDMAVRSARRDDHVVAEARFTLDVD